MTKRKSTRIKPEIKYSQPKLKWQKRAKLFFYNPEKKTVMGRTCGKWGQLGLFYTCFYTGLFSISAFMYTIFSQYVLSKSEPRLQGLHNVLNGTPGVTIIPVDLDGILYYKLDDMRSAASHIASIEKELKKNHGINSGKNVVDCSKQMDKKDDQVCQLEKSVFFPNNSLCNKKSNFGFPFGKPCFIVKVNKLYNWKPEPYAKLSDVPSEYPKNRYDPKSIGIYCFGVSSPDIDNLSNVTYIPSTGIPFKYFPYLNKNNYAAPFTWIQLSNIKRHIMVTIRCKAYVKNMNIYHRISINFVDFYVLID